MCVPIMARVCILCIYNDMFICMCAMCIYVHVCIYYAHNYLQNVNHIESELSHLQAEADALKAQSVQDLDNATNILTSAQQLRNNTDQVTIQQLQGKCAHTHTH